MANRAKFFNHRNHMKQLKINKAKAKYNWGMMLTYANANKLRETYKDIHEGETN